MCSPASSAPTSGKIEYDGKDINDYDKETLHGQIGFVFQDSIMFNIHLRENIAFSNTVTKMRYRNWRSTRLSSHDFVERSAGRARYRSSPSAARASPAARSSASCSRARSRSNPKILLLDDFTARVDTHTEQKDPEQCRQELSGHHAHFGDAEDRMRSNIMTRSSF